MEIFCCLIILLCSMFICTLESQCWITEFDEFFLKLFFNRNKNYNSLIYNFHVFKFADE